MTDYRLYILDGSGHISRHIEIEAKDDERAFVIASEKLELGRAELWLRDRLVHSFDADRRQG